MASTAGLKDAPHTPAQAAKAKPYDPIKAVEGMFNGSVTRIAQVLGNPKLYGDSTPYVLGECAKRYQDALDDCEISILDTKWYLEQKLRENKERREAAAKAQETGTPSAKRKHDALEEPSEPQQQETPTKKTKPSDETAPTLAEIPEHSSPLVEGVKQEDVIKKAPKSSPSPQPQAVPEPEESSREEAKPPDEKKPKPEPDSHQPEALKQEPQTRTSIDDYLQQQPDATPAMTNDENNFFESMFGDPTEDGMNETNNDDMNLDFMNSDFSQDMNMNMNTTATSAQQSQQSQSQPQPQSQSQSQPQPQQPQQQPQAQPQLSTQSQSQNQQEHTTTQPSFSSMLPGLEQYANSTIADDAANPNNPAFGNNPFNEPNIFDSLLGGDDDFDQNHEFTNISVDDPDDMNVNFDDLFGDGP